MQKNITKHFIINEQSFNDLYENYYVRLCRFVYYYVNCKDTAEEIVQDFFTGLWEKRNRLIIKTNIKSYLYISVKNEAFSKLKKLMKIDKSEGLKADDEGSVQDLDIELFKRKLEQAMGNLPEKCRMIYCLKYIEGLTGKEISRYLEISEKTVETQIYRALNKLRRELAPFKTKFFNGD
jgi:RNA polymerase sigma-70 factor (ECF subfamily)